MIELCRRQLDFGDGFIAEEVGDLREDWVRNVDSVLEDPLLLDTGVSMPEPFCKFEDLHHRIRVICD